jgi:hypothetical protein
MNSIIINLDSVYLIKNLVETMEQSSACVGEECKILETQKTLASINLLSLPHLPTRTSGRK